jgi:phage protein D
MKRLLTFGLGAAMLFAGTVAFTQDAKAPAAGDKAAPTSSMPAMAQMDEHMKKMQALHEKMMSAATPEERQKAMEEARKEMQESMAMMKPMMQGGGMMGGGMMAQKGKSADTGAQTQMMGKRMDMMQMMMQMMMDQQGMTGAPKAPESAPKK